MSTPQPDESRALAESEALQKDARLVVQTLMRGTTTPFDTPTGDHTNYFAITGDLFRQCADFCLHAAILLSLRVFASPAVLIRAAYEREIELHYMITKGDKLQNAVRCRARTLLEVVAQFSDEPAGHEAVEILARMPPAIVEEQKQPRYRRHGWTGLDRRQLAEAVGVAGHTGGYGLLSWYAHGRIAGYDVRENRPGGGELFSFKFEEQSSPGHRQGLANFARRTLHETFKVIARDWLGQEPTTLDTSNPEETRNG
jgi:hypothetical protein